MGGPLATPVVPGGNGRPAARRRVAVFTGNYDLVIDGVALILNRLVTHLESIGYEVMVFAPTGTTPALDHAGTLVSIGSIPAPGWPGYRMTFGVSRRARARLESFRPDLIHIATPDFLGWSALRFARKRGIPVVASYHTHFPWYLRFHRLAMIEPLVHALLRRFYGRCTHIYVASESIARVLETFGLGDRLRMWEGGVDPVRFGPHQRSMAWRARHGLEPADTVVTFVGRLAKEKGLDTLVQVIRTLEARGVKHRSMMVGAGPAMDAVRARLPNTVFTGFLTGDDLAAAFASSDMLLFPGDIETFGMVTLEAMASGLPAVCADATGSKSLVEDGVTGLLAPVGDVAAFADHCTRLVEDAPLRQAMGSTARKRAVGYEWSIVMRRIASHYDSILRPRTDPIPAAPDPDLPPIPSRTSATRR
ncbi:MAG TPA: glycosyltransferase family 1 protein [Gemmatimonadales bacterium]